MQIHTTNSFYMPGSTATVAAGLRPFLSAVASGEVAQAAADARVERIMSGGVPADERANVITQTQRKFFGEAGRPPVRGDEEVQTLVSHVLDDSKAKKALASIDGQTDALGAFRGPWECRTVLTFPDIQHPFGSVGIITRYQGIFLYVSPSEAATWVNNNRSRFGLNFCTDKVELDPVDLRGNRVAVRVVLGVIQSTLSEYQKEEVERTQNCWYIPGNYNVIEKYSRPGERTFEFSYQGIFANDPENAGQTFPKLWVVFKGGKVYVSISTKPTSIREDTHELKVIIEIAKRIESALKNLET